MLSLVSPTFLLITFNAYMFGIINVHGCGWVQMKCPAGETINVNTCIDDYVKTNGDSLCGYAHTDCLDYPRTPRSDGCSGPVTDLMHEQGFKPACALHDMCYATYGAPQSHCDIIFNYNMQKICDELIFLAIPGCYANALIYTSAVIAAGESSWQTGQDEAKKACARRRLMNERLSNNNTASIPNRLETKFYFKFNNDLLDNQDLLNEFISAVGKTLNEIMSDSNKDNKINYIELGSIDGFGHIDNIKQADGITDDKLDNYSYLNIKFDVDSRDLLVLLKQYLLDDNTQMINKAIENKLRLGGKNVFDDPDFKVYFVDAKIY
mmetsp:Transcript_40196/g.35485  ORF Transcript_40196/g.35485 Transcript_40196/m.35485 type:complete len:322 (-) Transcript_40196:45-1010(-)